jgi:hypothetical protein
VDPLVNGVRRLSLAFRDRWNWSLADCLKLSISLRDLEIEVRRVAPLWLPAWHQDVSSSVLPVIPFSERIEEWRNFSWETSPSACRRTDGRGCNAHHLREREPLNVARRNALIVGPAGGDPDNTWRVILSDLDFDHDQIRASGLLDA